MAIIPPGIVWIASFPKSGNTWTRVLLANLLNDSDTPVDINHLPHEMDLFDAQHFMDSTLVDPGLLRLPELDRMRRVQGDFFATGVTEPLFGKTHDRFAGDDGRPVLGTGARAALYIMRDPRDVAVSLSHHFSETVDAVIAAITGDDYVLGGAHQLVQRVGGWGRHVESWTEQTAVPVMVVRYEDLLADTVGRLTDIAAFLGCDVGAGQIRRAVALSDLRELQRQEEVHGFRERMRRQKRFFRAGRIGEWRNVLTPAQIDTIGTCFGAVMARWGYTLSGLGA